ncbi:phosphoribosylamine-glycine ligase [Pneumocystis carinii B80]|uniref:Phosphoribosylamine-glycine ligase n=1 Tax=Pneumocystis carinii (strain B80) TaxID=1408658 RepID=A0A0W4ZCL5_PNEC8|nr:phosphoribosylamine-glycine ligase [Pneumocystis carinii B80]KTW26089.1 phosphoribosylamine-glycine ligase [Pneumocystis carinii B80]
MGSLKNDIRKMKLLIIGNGGREHALTWRLLKSPRVERIFVAPGNGGTDGLCGIVENVDIGPLEFEKMVKFAISNDIDLVIPGTEAPLVAGAEEYFRKAGINFFGPSKKAAQMEGSKAFSKGFMERNNIPTAKYKNFTSYELAKEYISQIDYDVVIKASGLASGKGVIVPESKSHALASLHEIMENKIFGMAGDEVVIEERLIGEEVSILAFSDGYIIKPLPPVRDYKRLYDGDKGPNTGGMGCYSPSISTLSLLEQIREEILQKTIDGMRKEGFPFVGLLFAGIMLTSDGPKVLEYNVRFGDPETQTVLPLLHEDTDLLEIMLACVERRLDFVQLRISPLFSVSVVLAAKGYPCSYEKGKSIDIGIIGDEAIVFHSGTAISESKGLVTTGGRILSICATGTTLEEAAKNAYKNIKSIFFENMFNRNDIAYKACNTSKEKLKDVITYLSSGVSIDTSNNFLNIIKPKIQTTKRLGSDAIIGGFGGVFDLKNLNYKDPLLVGTIDGIGTKIKIAQIINKYDTIGIDLVAMNVNDLIVQGAEPLFFLDYYACRKLDISSTASFIDGVCNGCIMAGCALIGGETAEMPGIYYNKDFDSAGAAIGIVERKNLLPASNIMKSGDMVLGLSSSGLHSNGFSLIRKIIEKSGLYYNDPAPWDPSTTIGLSLLTPTRIYVKSLLNLVKKGVIKGMAHITGGGFLENIPRILPDNLMCEIDVTLWELPKVFCWLKKIGNVPIDDFSRTLNMGIGMVIIVDIMNVTEVLSELKNMGENVYTIGVLSNRTSQHPKCLLKNLDAWE